MEALMENATTTLPLSPEQSALWSMQGGDYATSASVVLLIDIEGDLDELRLRAAVDEVVRAHGVLRHAICPVTGYRGLRQRCLEAMPLLPWVSLDLRGNAAGGKHLVSSDWVKEFGCAGLDIAHGQLVRGALARTGDVRSTLALAVSGLVADRGSLQTLFDQIAAAYFGSATINPLEVFQYAQFVEWREDLIDDENADTSRTYWMQYLTAADELLPPSLSYRQGEERQAGEARIHITRSLERERSARIAATANSLGVDAGVLIQAVWWLALARLTGYSRFVGGWQHDCRYDYDVMQGAVGLFDKVLPVVVELTAAEPFSAWLERFAGITRAHVEAQEYWVVDAPPITAHLAVGFAVTKASWCHGDTSRWSVSALPGLMPCFELALEFTWGEDGAALALHADASRYTRDDVDCLLRQFSTLLEAVLERPAARVADLPLIGAEEREALLTMDAVHIDFGTLSVAEHIARWAEATPNAPAIEAGECRLSYRDFVARANRLAHWLRAQGVAPGALVALDMSRSVDLVIAILAVWRAGAAYLPLEPEWPVARRQAVLADAMPALVLHASLPADVAARSGEELWREAALGGIELDGFSDAPPMHHGSLQDLAYVLYTSGSTGQPKGVAIEHGQLLNYVAAASSAMELAICRRWALTSSVVADLGNTALFGSLFNGACLVVAGPEETGDAEAFRRFIAERRIDGLKMVPSHLEALLECDSPCLPRTLVLGGEAAPRSLIERIGRLAPECRIYNHYGPTEAAVGVMVHALPACPPIPDVLPLSRVLANNRVYVLDEAMRLVPSGALGELYIGGAQLCRGYLNRNDSSAFVADPFHPGERLYRTGDLAYVLPGGGIRLAGRADHQVKVRGFRVEPAEVESGLLACPGVRQAVVMAVPSGEDDSHELIAYVVANEELASEIRGEVLRVRLAALLPAHMLPVRYVLVSEFPRLSNGKIDRLALAKSLATNERRPLQEAPRDAVEAVLVDCMAKLLGREAIGIEDDFFDLGGHSLLAIKLVARVRKLLHVDLALGTVFDFPTVAGLAGHLRKQHASAALLEQAALAALPESERECWKTRSEGACAVEASPSSVLPRAPWVHVTQRGHVSHRVPLFCFPGLFVNPSEYEPIWSTLEGERELHGFVCHTLSESHWSARSLETLASGYVAHIQNTVGNGPVALLGWSAGGDLAFEVASQLLRSKVDVRFVGLLDVRHTSALLMTADVSEQSRREADAMWKGWIRGSSMAAQWRTLLSRIDAQEVILAAEHVRREYTDLPLDGADIDAEEYRVWAAINYSAMMRRYEWRRCDVPTYVWVADGTLALKDVKVRDWSDLSCVRHSAIVGDSDHRSLLHQLSFLQELRDMLRRIDVSAS